MAELEITITCPKCGSAGKVDMNTYNEDGQLVSTDTEDPCTRCQGTGKVTWGTIKCETLEDIQDKCNDIFEKCGDILNKLDELNPLEAEN